MRKETRHWKDEPHVSRIGLDDDGGDLPGVCRECGVERGRVDRKGPPVELSQFASALKETAVDENALAVEFEEVPRTGDGLRSAVEADRLCHRLQVCPVSTSRVDR